jgi:ABC-type Na+ efflux pump permease subunit
MSRTRIAAVIAKELREYRRNRFLVGSMIVYPAIFTALPIATFFARQPSVASASLSNHIGLSLLYMLLIPMVVPATISGFAIVGEREAGTLEPFLTTPVRPEEILIGKAIAIAIPALAIAYAVYGLFLLAVELFAHSFVASAVFHSNQVLAQPVFIPLLTAWSIWVGIAISTRASDVRVAQQFAVLGSLPPVAVTSLMGFGVINPTLTLAIILAGTLLAIDLAGWRLVATLFNRERLITGAAPKRPARPHHHDPGLITASRRDGQLGSSNGNSA